MALEHPLPTPPRVREEEALLRAVRRIRSVLLGIVFGLTFGAVIFAATAFLLLKGGEHIGPHLALLGQFFPGYSVTWGGSLLGALYGFVTGFAVGWLVGWVYNTLLHVRGRRR